MKKVKRIFEVFQQKSGDDFDVVPVHKKLFTGDTDVQCIYCAIGQ